MQSDEPTPLPRACLSPNARKNCRHRERRQNNDLFPLCRSLSWAKNLKSMRNNFSPMQAHASHASRFGYQMRQLSSNRSCFLLCQAGQDPSTFTRPINAGTCSDEKGWRITPSHHSQVEASAMVNPITMISRLISTVADLGGTTCRIYGSLPRASNV